MLYISNRRWDLLAVRVSPWNLDRDGFYLIENHRCADAERVLYLGDLIGVRHQRLDGFFTGLRRHTGAIGHVLGRLTYAPEIAVHFYFDADDPNSLLVCLTIKIIAVTGRQSQKQQFAAVST